MDRTSPLLDSLTTRVKQRVLSATLLHPGRAWYLHELAKNLHISPSTVQHELRLFAGAGLLTRTRHGNRVYYQADRQCPIFRALSEVLIKTSGLADIVWVVYTVGLMLRPASSSAARRSPAISESFTSDDHQVDVAGGSFLACRDRAVDEANVDFRGGGSRRSTSSRSFRAASR